MSEEKYNEAEDWVPPELLERARTAAERDAQSLQRRESGEMTGKGKRQQMIKPRREFPRTAAGAMIACMALPVLDWLFKLLGVGGAALSKSRAELVFAAAVAVVTLLACLVMLLPMPKLRHRIWLAPVLGLNLGLNYVLGLLQNSVMENAAARALSVAGAMLFLPVIWIFIGVVTRKRTERFAALSAALAAVICVAGAFSEQGEGFSVSTALTALHYLSLGVALWCSPVTHKAILQKNAAG